MLDSSTGIVNPPEPARWLYIVGMNLEVDRRRVASADELRERMGGSR